MESDELLEPLLDAPSVLEGLISPPAWPESSSEESSSSLDELLEELLPLTPELEELSWLECFESSPKEEFDDELLLSPEREWS